MDRSQMGRSKVTERRHCSAQAHQGDGMDVPTADCPPVPPRSSSALFDTIGFNIKVCRELIRQCEAHLASRARSVQEQSSCGAFGEAVGPPSAHYRLFPDVPEDCKWARNLEKQLQTRKFKLMPEEELAAFISYLTDGPSQYQSDVEPPDGPSQYQSTVLTDGPFQYHSDVLTDGPSQYQSDVPTDGPFQYQYQFDVLTDGPSQYQSDVEPTDGPPQYQSDVEPTDRPSQYQSDQPTDGPSQYQSDVEPTDGPSQYQFDVLTDGPSRYQSDVEPTDGPSQYQYAVPTEWPTLYQSALDLCPSDNTQELEQSRAGQMKVDHRDYSQAGDTRESSEDYSQAGDTRESSEDYSQAGHTRKSSEEALRGPPHPSHALLNMDVGELSSITHSPHPQEKLRDFIKSKLAPCNSTPRNPGVQRVFETRDADDSHHSPQSFFTAVAADLSFQHSSSDPAVSGTSKEGESPADVKETQWAPVLGAFQADPEGEVEGEFEKTSEEAFEDDSEEKAGDPRTSKMVEGGEDREAKDKGIEAAAWFSDGDDEEEEEEKRELEGTFEEEEEGEFGEEEEEEDWFTANPKDKELTLYVQRYPSPVDNMRTHSPAGIELEDIPEEKGTAAVHEGAFRSDGRETQDSGDSQPPSPPAEREDKHCSPYGQGESGWTSPQQADPLSYSFRAHSTLDDILQAQTQD